MKNYKNMSQNLENDHEAQLLNEFYDQEEEIHWKPVAKSEKQRNLEKTRDTYYLQRAILQQKMKGKENADY